MGNKIVSIDPSGNGVTAIVVIEYDYSLDEPIQIIDFAQVDFRANGETNNEYIKEIRYLATEDVIEYVKEINPYCVILENYIAFRNQIGETGKSFPTSELIGALDLELRRNKIPVIKPRSSDLYTWDGYGNKSFKNTLTQWTLESRGILNRGYRNAISVSVNGELHRLVDYKIGAKSDHIIMAIRHAVNEIENKNPNLFERVERIKQQRYEKQYRGDDD